MAKTYCEYIALNPGDELQKTYHDTEYGFPIADDNLLFERLIFEINQAGLSWATILKKQHNFRAAYDGFRIEKVAAYGEADIARLLGDAGIIRNRLKINAAIENAKKILTLQKSHGSFLAWLESHHPKTKEEWVKLFKKEFKFTGGEIVNEFLMSTGFLPGAHEESCPVFNVVKKTRPAWLFRH